jgi:hypothetical protein
VAWRIQLGPDLIGRRSLNALEFLAALIGVWVEHHQLGPNIAADDVLLSQGARQHLGPRVDGKIEFRR